MGVVVHWSSAFEESGISDRSSMKFASVNKGCGVGLVSDLLERDQMTAVIPAFPPRSDIPSLHPAASAKVNALCAILPCLVHGTIGATGS